MTDTVFEHDTYRVHIPAGVLTKARRLARIRAPLETGGMLFGELVDGVAHVRGITGPGRRAERHRTSYVPDYRRDTRLVHRLWPRFFYMGSWHTHPGGALRLSAMDEDALRSELSEKRHWALEMLLAGDSSMRDGVQLALYTGFHGQDEVHRMSCERRAA